MFSDRIFIFGDEVTLPTGAIAAGIVAGMAALLLLAVLYLVRHVWNRQPPRG